MTHSTSDQPSRATLNDFSNDDHFERRYPFGKLAEPTAQIPHSLIYELHELINYLWDDEHTDYHYADDEARAGHIFEPLQKLRNWTDGHLHEIEGGFELGAASLPSPLPTPNHRSTLSGSTTAERLARVEHAVDKLRVITAATVLLLFLSICNW